METLTLLEGQHQKIDKVKCIFEINLIKREDMLKLENWIDQFKFNKELFDDDYNHG